MPHTYIQRPLNAHETSFYTVMLQHYNYRLSVAPKHTKEHYFLRNSRNTIQHILNSKNTYTREQEE